MAKSKTEYRYRVCRTGTQGIHFQILKLDYQTKEQHGQYDLVVNWRINDGDNDGLWCDCPGFRVQKYAKFEHKHVRMVRDYIMRDLDGAAMYKLRPDNSPKFINELTLD